MSRALGRARGSKTIRTLTAVCVAVLTLAITLTTTLAMIAVTSPTAHADSKPVGWLTTSGARILDSSGRPYQIKAVSWFGMETSNCAPHGLWQIGLDAGMAQLASFGFNAIRLPYSNQCLDSSAPVTGIDFGLNPSLQGKTPLQVMDAVVASAGAHGLSVILDRHRPDTASQSELWYTASYSEARWISDWTMLARRYRDNRTVIGADLHNEPHGRACWGCGDPARDWAAAATRAGNAVLAVNPKLLIVVEGIEKQGDNQATWWGGGLADVAAKPIRLAVANRVVYSPHDYPASIYDQPWFSAANYPADLPALWDANWGYLAKKNIAPVLLGEFGSRLQTESDRQWLATLVQYLKTNQLSYAYWSFNPNSGDTGGLVADDWVTPERAKLDALAPILTGEPAPAITAPGNTPGNTPVSAPPTSPSAATPTASASATPSTTPSVRSSATPSADSSAPMAPSSSGTGRAGLGARWQLNSSWNAGYVAQLRLTATDTDADGWTVSWTDPSATSVANAWGMTCTVGNGRISCSGADWAAHIPAGQSVTVGLQVDSGGTAPTNPPLALS